MSCSGCRTSVGVAPSVWMGILVLAAPRVFVSSTWYDLRYIRENLRYFIKTIGYEPVLSEDGTVFYNPKLHVQDSCIAEIPNCHMFVLIVGGKYGSSFKGGEKSITNTEAAEAVRLRIPIFALVEFSVLSDFYLHEANRENLDVDVTKVKYPSADSTRIFDFIREVRNNALNNALVPFSDFADIENYLRRQWAAMMLSFLSEKNEADRVSDTLSILKAISERVEVMSRQILEFVGSKAAKLCITMYDIMLQYGCFRDIAYLSGRVTPREVLLCHDFSACCNLLNLEIEVSVEEDEDENFISSSGNISPVRFRENAQEYARARKELLDMLDHSGLSRDDFIAHLGEPATIAQFRRHT